MHHVNIYISKYRIDQNSPKNCLVPFCTLYFNQITTTSLFINFRVERYIKIPSDYKVFTFEISKFILESIN